MRKSAQLHYFMIALAIVILLRSLFVFYTVSICLILLDIFIAISLLAGSIPRVVSIPIRYCYYIRKTELISLAFATVLFVCLLIERIMGA